MALRGVRNQTLRMYTIDNDRKALRKQIENHRKTQRKPKKPIGNLRNKLKTIGTPSENQKKTREGARDTIGISKENKKKH